MFVATHAAPTDWPHPDAPFTFVTDGVGSAIEQARTVAGDATVAIARANVTQQALSLGLVDKITVDLVPILLGDGIPFFANLAKAPIRLSDPTVVQGQAGHAPALRRAQGVVIRSTGEGSAAVQVCSSTTESEKVEDQPDENDTDDGDDLFGSFQSEHGQERLLEGLLPPFGREEVVAEVGHYSCRRARVRWLA